MTRLNTQRRYLPLTAAALLVCLPGAVFAGPAGPQGIWLDNSGRGAVEIKTCGDRLCGHVVWVKSGADAKGCGRQIIGDAAQTGGKYHGWIYSPEDRKRYNVEFSPASDGRLKVVGYAGIRLFSKTMFWTPAPADLVRCDAPAKQEAAAPAKGAPPAPAPAAAPAATQAKSPATASSNVAAVSQTAEAPPPAAPPAPAAKPAVAGDSSDAAKAPRSATVSPPEEAGGGAAPSEDEAAGSDTAAEPGLEKLARVLDRVVKRTPGGDCKLDLPWVKVQFRCQDE